MPLRRTPTMETLNTHDETNISNYKSIPLYAPTPKRPPPPGPYFRGKKTRKTKKRKSDKRKRTKKEDRLK